MKVSKYMILGAVAVFAAGCQPLANWTPKWFSEPAAAPRAPETTFDDVIKHTQANPLEGKVLAEMQGLFDPAVKRYAFVTLDGRPIFIFGEAAGIKLAIVAQDGTVKKETFAGYKLDKAILNQKILYIGSKGNSAIKYNTDSFNFSDVDKSEMDHTSVVLDEFKLPGKEKQVYTQEGYIYTKDGFIFDVKNHEYLLDNDKTKKKFYETADVAYGSYLFELEPRLDQAINLKTIKAKGDNTVKGKSYGIHLNLQRGYDVKNLDHAIGPDGQLFLFAMGAEVNGKLCVKMFEIPLRSFTESQKQ